MSPQHIMYPEVSFKYEQEILGRDYNVLDSVTH